MRRILPIAALGLGLTMSAGAMAQTTAPGTTTPGTTIPGVGVNAGVERRSGDWGLVGLLGLLGLAGLIPRTRRDVRDPGLTNR